MTVSGLPNKITLSCSGTQTNFDFDFGYLNNSDIQVYLPDIDGDANDSNKQTEGSDYDLVTTDKSAGGTIVFKSAPPDTKEVFIIREVPLTQTVPFKPNTNFPEKLIETGLDKLTMGLQQLKERIDRAITFPLNSDTSDVSIPEPEANKGLKWDADGKKLVNSTYDVDTAALEAANSAAAAEQSEISAKQSETNAQQSEISAKQSEDTAKDWAIKMNGTVDGSEYSAKYYANEAAIFTAGSLNQKQVTNCILSAPNGVVSFSGTTITIKSGITYLTGIGRNDDMTLWNAKNTLAEDKSVVFSSIGAGAGFAAAYVYDGVASYCPWSEVYRTSVEPGAKITTNQIWIDEVTNKVYHSPYQSDDWAETSDLIVVAKLNVTDSTIDSLVEERPMELVKKGDIDWVSKAIAPDFSSYKDLPKTKDLVQQADRDCYLRLVCGSGNDATLGICDAEGSVKFEMLNSDSAAGVAIGSMTPLIPKGTYFKITYLVGDIDIFQKVYTLGGN